MSPYEPWASSPEVRDVMRGNRSRDTRPELAVRRRLHALGLRYRVSYRPVPDLRRTADIAFPRQRVAIFIDGCYWHSCPEHGTKAARNADYWSTKLASNAARDADTNARLREAGWTVARYWEHEDPDAVAADIRALVTQAAG